MPVSYDMDKTVSQAPTTNWVLEQGVGIVDFPVSTSNPAARGAFNSGLALLEDFEYAEAINQFQLAKQLDPSFAMAYWGEAMSHLRILWSGVDYDRALKIYQQLDQKSDLTRISAIEEALIEATRSLLTQGDKELPGYNSKSSLMAYRLAMQAVQQQFPNDPDVASLYAHAVIGTRYGINDYDTNDIAGKPLLALYDKYPYHPGLNHFILHSFENPVQTYHARKAAERFAKIAPGAIHVLHMPSHHYFCQGDWQKSAAVNKFAWQQSIKKQRAMHLPDDYLEYHGNFWRVYALLQMQQPKAALQAIKEMAAKEPTGARDSYLGASIAHFLLHTQGQKELYDQAAAIPVNLDLMGSHYRVGYVYAKVATDPQLSSKKIAVAINSLNKAVLPTLAQQSPSIQAEVTIIMQQLKALAKINSGDYKQGIKDLTAIAKTEDHSFREHGVPLVVKPSHELLADTLMQQQAYGEALQHYQLELISNPGRRLSLQGLATAARHTNRPFELDYATKQLALYG